MALLINNNYSPNFDIKKRLKNSIKFLIIHYTGMKKESEAISRLLDFNSKVSCHYFIKNNGDIIRMVPDSYTAWHAGKSKWKKFVSLNKYSIGIEIHNPGHDHGYKSFSQKQVKSLLSLVKDLKKKFYIDKKNILGHSDIAPNRKKDPGEKFPWELLSKRKIGLWHTVPKNTLKKNRKVKLNFLDKKIFFNNLFKIGYMDIRKKIHNNNRNSNFIIKAFQRRFRQELIDGKTDRECFIISNNLVKKFN